MAAHHGLLCTGCSCWELVHVAIYDVHSPAWHAYYFKFFIFRPVLLFLSAAGDESLHLLANLTKSANFEGFCRFANPVPAPQTAPAPKPWLHNYLRQHASFWTTFCTSAFVPSVIFTGCELPMANGPPLGPLFRANHPSAFQFL
jgi:hypothetical protein